MTGIHSKAATKEYRDGWDRIFVRHKQCPRCGLRGWYEAEDGDAYCAEPGCPHAERVRAEDEESERMRACSTCAVDGQMCECDEAVCHVPDGAEDPLKCLMAGVDMMPVSEE